MKDPISMRDVITELGMTSQYPLSNGSKDYVCPLCGEGTKEKKLNIDFRKDVFRCNKCDEFKGNAVDFWAFYRGMQWGTKEARREAASDYRNATRGPSKEPRKIKTPERAFTQPEDMKLADIDNLDAAYTAFLEQLDLSKKHFHNLTETRGLSAKEVEKNGYKTAPLAGSNVLAQNVLNAGIPLEGVPGFYMKNGEWRFVNYGSGFLIPSRDTKGRIHSMQIRKDAKSDRRYFTISSSGKDHGTKGKTFPHFNKGDGRTNEIIITEGPLKADIISYFSGFPTYAVLGVSALKDMPMLLKEFKKNGGNRVWIAYDRDMLVNPHVLKALDTLKRMITRAGISRQGTFVWDNTAKGLDDYLLIKKSYLF